MKWWGVVLLELARPDDQGRDWYGWVTNQMSHVTLGMLVTVFAILHLKFNPLTPIFILATGKEIYDLNNGGTFKDSFNDWVFMIVGGVLADALFDDDISSINISFFVIVVGLIAGLLPRIKNM